MLINDLIKVVETEKECVVRNSKNECNRDCANCGLVLEDKEIISAYDHILKMLEAEKVKLNISGRYIIK